MKKHIVTIALAIGAVGCSSEHVDDIPLAPSSEQSSRTPSSPWASHLDAYPPGALADSLDENESELVGAHNWRTSKPYTELEVRRLKRLLEGVGDNLSLTPLDADARRAREAWFSETDELARWIDGGQATLANVEEYYGRKIAYYDDRIEVIEFILGEDGWDAETVERYDRYLDVARKERTRFENQRDSQVARFSRAQLEGVSQ